jgi:hypothetical protein
MHYNIEDYNGDKINSVSLTLIYKTCVNIIFGSQNLKKIIKKKYKIIYLCAIFLHKIQ